MKKTPSRLFALLLLLTLFTGLSVPALAAEKPTIRGTKVLWVGVGKCAVLLDNVPENAKNFKITSSKPSVLKVGKDSDDSLGMWMKPVKVGKAKVTISFKSSGKTRKITETYQVKKYPAPFSSMKVDGKKVNLEKNKVMADVMGYTKKSVKVHFTLNSGWSVKSLTGMKFGMDNKPFTWKKNKAVSFEKAGTLVFSILLVNKASGDEFEYLIMVSR